MSSKVFLTIGVAFFGGLYFLMHWSGNPTMVDGPRYQEPAPSADQDYEQFLSHHWERVAAPLAQGWGTDHEWRQSLLADLYPRMQNPEYRRSAGYFNQLLEERKRQHEAWMRNRKIRLSSHLTEARPREAYFDHRAEEAWQNTVREFHRVIFY